MTYTLDSRLRHAVADLCDHLGATGPEIGCRGTLDDDSGGYYAHTDYRGTRVTDDDRHDPNVACIALAARLVEAVADQLEADRGELADLRRAVEELRDDRLAKAVRAMLGRMGRGFRAETGVEEIRELRDALAAHEAGGVAR